MSHRLTREQVVPAPLDQVWDYFSIPDNLNEMTPPDMHFKIIHGSEGPIFQGQLIEYSVQFMPLIQSRWLTEIAHVQDKIYFVDEQRIGPYQFWYHEHRFVSVEDGTLISDQVTYDLPFGPLGDLFHSFWIGPRLESIFDYRQKKITALFGA
jgi:ligand-binding SRPBCC domain-containing protein